MRANLYNPKTKGFTLIELLVVISVIALLMAILVPVLAKAKCMAKTIRCASNVRQIGLSFNGFAANNENRIIIAKDPRSAVEKERAWNFELIPYVGQDHQEDAFEDKADVFFCPADKDPYPIGYGSYPHGTAFTSYALNGCYTKATSRRPGCKLGPAGGYKFSNIKHPSACMLMVETSYSYQIYDMDNPKVSTLGLDKGGHHRQTSGFFHDNIMNVLFVDGHMQKFKGTKTDPVTPAWSTRGYMFWDDLSLPDSNQDKALWGPGYK